MERAGHKGAVRAVHVTWPGEPRVAAQADAAAAEVCWRRHCRGVHGSWCRVAVAQLSSSGKRRVGGDDDDVVGGGAGEHGEEAAAARQG